MIVLVLVRYSRRVASRRVVVVVQPRPSDYTTEGTFTVEVCERPPRSPPSSTLSSLRVWSSSSRLRPRRRHLRPVRRPALGRDEHFSVVLHLPPHRVVRGDLASPARLFAQRTPRLDRERSLQTLLAKVMPATRPHRAVEQRHAYRAREVLPERRHRGRERRRGRRGRCHGRPTRASRSVAVVVLAVGIFVFSPTTTTRRRRPADRDVKYARRPSPRSLARPHAWTGHHPARNRLPNHSP